MSVQLNIIVIDCVFFKDLGAQLKFYFMKIIVHILRKLLYKYVTYFICIFMNLKLLLNFNVRAFFDTLFTFQTVTNHRA